MEAKDEYSIVVNNLSKSFLIAQERHFTLKDRFVTIFRHVSKYKLNVLNDISFTVNRGESIGIIGSNGSGKSTLLKLLSGIYIPNHGEIMLNGRSVSLLELGVGFNIELTGWENIYLNGMMLGLTKKQISSEIVAIANFSGINKIFLNTPIKYYSSGMQLRLAFSVAMHVNADIYLMDEILAVGDQDFQRKCKIRFNELKRDKKTMILVGHNTDMIANYCERIIWLKDGKIEMYGNALDVLSKYLHFK